MGTKRAQLQKEARDDYVAWLPGRSDLELFDVMVTETQYPAAVLDEVNNRPGMIKTLRRALTGATTYEVLPKIPFSNDPEFLVATGLDVIIAHWSSVAPYLKEPGPIRSVLKAWSKSDLRLSDLDSAENATLQVVRTAWQKAYTASKKAS